jgi:hypothetical protein
MSSLLTLQYVCTKMLIGYQYKFFMEILTIFHQQIWAIFLKFMYTCNDYFCANVILLFLVEIGNIFPNVSTKAFTVLYVTLAQKTVAIILMR